MHGTGLFNAISNLMVGGSVITMEGRRFDPVELLDTIEGERINSMSIVGDAFAKPILRALDAEPDRWDISSLRVIVSSGVMWSAETKAGLLRHNDRLIMVDSLGSSEAIGMASSTVTCRRAPPRRRRSTIGPDTRVVTDDGRDVVPGSGEIGLVAMRGHTPIGYYKDPEKSAATFRIIDGVRYSIPGDFAKVDADGTVRLLGRGSQCINTGGEKVYPEEVEEVLKLHPTVADAAVVGVPDERFGEAITALVEPHAGDEIDEAELIAHVKEHLAGYKAPKRVVTVGIGRPGRQRQARLPGPQGPGRSRRCDTARPDGSGGDVHEAAQVFVATADQPRPSGRDRDDGCWLDRARRMSHPAMTTRRAARTRWPARSGGVVVTTMSTARARRFRNS